MFKYFAPLILCLTLISELATGQDEQIFSYRFLETDNPQGKSVVAFTSLAPAAATGHSWNFGQGGATSSSENPTFEYDISLTSLFTVTHSYTLNGETVSQEVEIQVNPAYFMVFPENVLGNLASLKRIIRSAFMIEKNDTSLLGNMRFEWTFNGFTPSNYSFQNASYFDYPNVYHTFSDGGKYLVSLKVHHISNVANTAEYSDTITVEPTFGADKLNFENIPNVITPNGDSINDYFEVVTSGTSRLSFKVFTRSGQLVYQHEANVVKWDGKN